MWRQQQQVQVRPEIACLDNHLPVSETPVHKVKESSPKFVLCSFYNDAKSEV